MNLLKRVERLENSLQINEIKLPEKFGRMPIFDLNKPGDADLLKEFENYIQANNIKSDVPLCIVITKI